MDKEIFKQLERINQFGLLTFSILVLVLSFGVYQELINEKEEYIFGCGVIDSGDTMFKSTAEMEGQVLFLQYCASCHNNNMVSDMTGPALGGCRERWGKYDGAIYKWIQNSKALAEKGNPRAKSMLEWSSADMTIFENLDSVQIESILTYIDAKYERSR